MRKSLLDKVTSSRDGLRLFQQERAIQEVTDLIYELMDAENVTRSELAERLGRSKGYVTQLLDGRTNMTIRTVADVFTALGRVVHFATHSFSRTKRAATGRRRTRSRAARRPLRRRRTKRSASV